MAYTKVIVTGGSSGLGLALATHYASSGAEVALVARNAHKLAAAAQQIQQQTGRAVKIASVDVCDEQAALQAMEPLIHEMGGIDLLINNAGVLEEGYFEDLDIEVYQRVMAVNLFGIINMIHACLPALKSSRGKIVNIASMAGYSGVFGYTAYSASKHALVGFSESLRYELKPQGVAVQMICPPEFDSPMVDALDKSRSPENRAHVLMVPKAPLSLISESTIKAIESDKFVHFTGFNASATAFAMRHFPSAVRYFADRVVGRESTKKR